MKYLIILTLVLSGCSVEWRTTSQAGYPEIKYSVSCLDGLEVIRYRDQGMFYRLTEDGKPVKCK